MDLIQVIFTTLSEYPAFTVFVSIVGILRVINKPLFTFLKVLTEATPSNKDNDILDLVEKSKAYKTFTFILDWFGSVKIK